MKTQLFDISQVLQEFLSIFKVHKKHQLLLYFAIQMNFKMT